MSAELVGRLEAEDIRLQLGKVIKALGNPEPPLDLNAVRELLRLDRRYFSTQDDGALSELVSRVRIAGRQIARRPTLLIDVIRKAQLSALWIPDGKRIFIDNSTPKLKHRWYEAHEIIHSLTPWHAEFLFGDSAESLDPVCHEKLEAEANFGAAQLLFLLDRFLAEARDLPMNLNTVRRLAKRFGNTVTATLRHFVEHAHRGLPVVGVIATNRYRQPITAESCRYFIRSPQFKSRFSRVTELQVLKVSQGYCRSRRGGPLGDCETVVNDDAGGGHWFGFQSFSNQYDVLTLGVYNRPADAVVSILR